MAPMRCLLLLSLVCLGRGDDFDPPEAPPVIHTGPLGQKFDAEGCTSEGQIKLNYTGTIQSLVAPRGCVVVMSLWAAGGSNSLRGPGGGGGGYIRGAVHGYGQTLHVLVGQGAVGQIPNDTAYPGQGPFFGGGGHQGHYCGHAGGGGGRTQVSLNPGPEVVDDILLVAGGGGGAGTCPGARGGSGGGKDEAWEGHNNGMSCMQETWNYGKGGYGGRAHNDHFNGHTGGDSGGGGGGGYYGGGAGEGHCDFGSAGGGGSSWYNKDLVFATEFVSANGTVPGRPIEELGQWTPGRGGSGPAEGGGNGLALFRWFKPKSTFGTH